MNASVKIISKNRNEGEIISIFNEIIDDIKEVDLRKKIEVVSETVFSTNLKNEFKQKIIEHLVSEKFFNKKKFEIEDFNEKFKDFINLINANALVKNIVEKKNEEEIIMLFNEIIGEINRIDLRERIELLENKVSLNLDEKLYSELLSLRNQLKSG